MSRNIDREITEICLFCEKGEPLNGNRRVLCPKHGVVAADYGCRKFVYDPLKRDPKNPPTIADFQVEDLIL